MLGPPRGAPPPPASGPPPGEAGIGIEADLIVHRPLLRIAQNVIGFLHVLEAIFGGFVAGVEIGVIFAGELPVGFADLVLRGAAFDAEGFVIVVFGLRCHI